MPSRTIQLGPSDIVAGRLFTNPEASAYDLTILQYMAETLCRVLMQPQAIPNQPRPYVLFLEELGGRFHRIALSKPELLLKPTDLTVVGFCGKKRPGVDRGPIDAVDEELILELSQHLYLLSYSTLQLESHNTVNLVLFSQRQGLMHWAASEKHALAVTMSPEYYTVIRLHNAILSGGLMSDNKLNLQRTKYYDFQSKTLWQAVREFRAPMANSIAA
jgi:hypothetical protein